MRYAISNGGKSARLAEKLEAGEVEWLGELPGNPSDEFDTGLTVDAGRARRKTAQEYAADEQVAQAEEAKRTESDTARDDAKRALAALDTIITGIDGATLVQAKVAIKQLAQIQRHIILATVGR